VHPEDERLYLLLDRYLAGEASPAEAQVVREHPELLEDLQLIKRVISERIPESDVDAAWAKAARALEGKPRRSRRIPLAVLAAAAVAIALIGGRAVLRRAPQLREVATAAAQRAVVRLRDGTQVTLAPKSRLRYAPDYGKAHRDVYLEGEAYFQVARDERLPFRVHTAASITEDLGTAFVITAYADQITTEVVVSEGRVALRRALADTLAAVPAALLLGARDLGRLGASGPATLQRGVDVDRQLAWTRGVLAFDGTPLGDAVRTLGRWYDVEIRIGDTDSALAARRLTATFTNEPIDLVLQRIALTLGLRVERAEGSVFLLRNGR
jgi:ferric-dicitrate binding protein FerR (iron transport regulator)